MDPHALADLRSLAYHQAVAHRLEKSPELIDRARGTLARWRAQGGRAMHLLDRWAEILEQPPAMIAHAMTEDSQEMRELRHASPFAGLLAPQERWRIWRSVLAQHQAGPA